MQVNQIRALFLDYFRKNGHQVIHSSPLVPHNDPTLMFTNAGMVQFKNYFTGAETSPFKKAATSQKCVRAGGKHNDLDNVGYTARHHTFFEMLGNFSFGDYFKELAIELAWSFLTKEMQLNQDKLYVTVYHTDDEAFNIWKKITGFSDNKIIRIKTADNFWSMGETGPCGPCTEIFYDHGEKYAGGLPGTADEDGDRYIEIWNLVFMQFEQLADGSRIKLPQPCVDTGMGLERMAAVVQGVNNNYETDLFKNIISASEELANDTTHITSHRIIADHLRASSFLIADGVMPSNEGRGYVLRRIMRRAMRHIHILGTPEPMMYKLVKVLVNEMGEAYPELKRAEAVITSTLQLEEERFRETLDRGIKLLNSVTENLKAEDTLAGSVAFKLYDTYGFPLDLTKDILKAKKITVDESGFEREMQEQRKRAKAAWVGSGEHATEEVWFDIKEKVGATEFLGYQLDYASAEVKAIVVDGQQVEKAANVAAIIILNQTPFYGESGGQVGDTGLLGDYEVKDTKKFVGTIFGHYTQVSGELKVGDIVQAKIESGRRDKIRANHSATHLLHRVLRQTLGEHVTQKGSIVTPEKLRFDFSHSQALTSEQILFIEMEVNKMIIANNEVGTEVLSQEKAIAKGAMALFGEKYGDEVRTVSMGESLELCGGTHVRRTGDIGLFKIVAEEAIAAGIRRIEAVTGLEAVKTINNRATILAQTAMVIKCAEKDIPLRVEALFDEKKRLEREIVNLRISQVLTTETPIETVGQIEFIAKKLIGIPPQDLKTIANDLLKKLKSGIVVITTVFEEKVSMLIVVSNSLTNKYKANDLLKDALAEIQGNGGGKADMAQAGGVNINGIDQAIQKVRAKIEVVG